MHAWSSLRCDLTCVGQISWSVPSGSEAHCSEHACCLEVLGDRTSIRACCCLVRGLGLKGISCRCIADLIVWVIRPNNSRWLDRDIGRGPCGDRVVGVQVSGAWWDDYLHPNARDLRLVEDRGGCRLDLVGVDLVQADVLVCVFVGDGEQVDRAASPVELTVGRRELKKPSVLGLVIPTYTRRQRIPARPSPPSRSPLGCASAPIFSHLNNYKVV